jgi:endonuclease YncB( thermonuclease family)
VDGDTLRLGNGETVRLVGIDAPEAGECGSERATDNLSRLVLGQQVRLRGPDQARDRYGRLLKYVDVGSRDAGLRLIKNGLAVARYDSRDGYGAHPRESFYVAAEMRTLPFSCD